MTDQEFIPPPPAPPSLPPPAEITSAPPPVGDANQPAWGLLDVALVTSAFVVVSFTVGVIGIFGARVLPGLRHTSLDALSKDVRILIPIQLAGYIFLLAAITICVTIRTGGPFWKRISWNPPRGKQLWTAVATGVGLAAVSALLEALLSRWSPQTTPMDEFFRGPLSAYLLTGFGIFVAPPVEELYFRGFLYPPLAHTCRDLLEWLYGQGVMRMTSVFKCQAAAQRRWTGVAPAVFITSAGFAFLHGSQLAFSWVPLLVIFVVGTVLAIVRVRTASVATGVVVHMTYNFILFLMTFISTGGFRHFDKH